MMFSELLREKLRASQELKEKEMGSLTGGPSMFGGAVVSSSTPIAQMNQALGVGAVKPQGYDTAEKFFHISKVENGYLVQVDNKRFIAESVEHVTGIVTTILIGLQK